LFERQLHLGLQVSPLDGGLAGAAASTRLLESWLYGVKPLDVPTFAFIGGLGTLASWLVTVFLHVSDYVARFTFQPTTMLSLTSRLRFAETDFSLQRSDPDS
jgi:hypothetical protein